MDEQVEISEELNIHSVRSRSSFSWAISVDDFTTDAHIHGLQRREKNQRTCRYKFTRPQGVFSR